MDFSYHFYNHIWGEDHWWSGGALIGLSGVRVAQQSFVSVKDGVVAKSPAGPPDSKVG